MALISQEGRNKAIPIDMLCSAMSIPRATYYRHLEDKNSTQNESRPSNTPINALNHLEKQYVLDLLHSEHFVDKTPYDVYYELMDKGNYYCSPRTMYRILAEHGETADRRLQRNHRDAVKPELIATRPNEVWSWDITKLLGPTKWVYYHLYVIMDIFSDMLLVGLLLTVSRRNLLESYYMNPH
jgi:putative transposase